jgi:hypothetical protein
MENDQLLVITVQEPVRNCLRDEAKKIQPDARPQAQKKQSISPKYVKNFSGLRMTQIVADRSPQ